MYAFNEYLISMRTALLLYIHADESNFSFYLSTRGSTLIKVSTGSVNVVTFNLSNLTHPNQKRIIMKKFLIDYCNFHLHSGFEFQFARRYISTRSCSLAKIFYSKFELFLGAYISLFYDCLNCCK